MIILGLTGGIGMGKSAVAAMFRRLNVPVHDADVVARAVTGRDGLALPAIKKHFPQCFTGNSLDRKSLGALVFQDDDARKDLEEIIHPFVWAAEQKFLRHCVAAGKKLAVLDIPLLYETGADARTHYVAVVAAPENVRRARVLRRAGMSPEILARIVAAQMPDGDKQARADFIIPTGGRLSATLYAVKTIIWVLKYARNRPRH